MALAILCSGQGRQHRGMFALTGSAPQAECLFTHAATLLGGRDPRELVETNDAGTLHGNRVAQILCTLQALAAAAALRDAFPQEIVVAGYSVGEVASWGVAGFLGAMETLDLAARRAELMSAAAAPGEGMVFVRGLPRAQVEKLGAQFGAAIAIVNPGEAFVVGGGGEAVDAFARAARAMTGTKVVRLPVEVASHTPRLAEASQQFRDVLRQVRIAAVPAGTRMLSGIDGAPVLDAETGFDKLAAQISHSVQWAACLQGCIEAGASAFFELGPGPALSQMAAGACRDVPCRSLEDFRTLRGARQWLAQRRDSI